MPERVTRGQGLLEGFLARQRAAMANRLIPPGSRGGRLLDVGSGSYPAFLLGTVFAERYGVDRLVPPAGHELDGVRLAHQDLEHDPALPFQDAFFDVVTMLAVFEHLEPTALLALLRDIRRVLRPDGTLVLTTPAGWTDPILRTFARLRLVSHEEIDEHKVRYRLSDVRDVLVRAGFPAASLRSGRFELGMNMWVAARA